MQTSPHLAEALGVGLEPVRLYGIATVATAPWLLGVIYEASLAGSPWTAVLAILALSMAFFGTERFRRTGKSQPEAYLAATLVFATAMVHYASAGAFADPSFAAILATAGLSAVLLGPALGLAQLTLAAVLMAGLFLGPQLGISLPGGIPAELHPLRAVINQLGPLLMTLAILYSAVVLQRSQLSSVAQSRGELEHATQVTARMQQRLEASGDSATCGLALGVGHRINNRLTAIIGDLQYLECLLEEADDPILHKLTAEAKPLVREALEVAWSTTSEVSQLSLLRSTGKIEEVDIGTLLQQAIQLLPSSFRRHAALRTEIADDLILEGDSGLILAAFTELLRNAGLSIESGTTRDNQIDVTAVLRRDRVVIRVADTGEGMTPSTLTRCREPGFSTRDIHRGMGMGLTNACNTFEAMGGRVELASRRGHGTRVEVHLPAIAHRVVAA